MRAKHLDSETLLTTAEVGALLQVHPNSVINWARQGELNCFRTPGGQRRIRAVDVVTFVKQRSMPIPRFLLGLDTKRLVLLDLNGGRDTTTIKRNLKGLSTQLVVMSDPFETMFELGIKPPAWCLTGISDSADERFWEMMKVVQKRKDLQQVNFGIIVGKADRKVKQRAQKGGVRLVLERPVQRDRLERDLAL